MLQNDWKFIIKFDLIKELTFSKYVCLPHLSWFFHAGCVLTIFKENPDLLSQNESINLNAKRFKFLLLSFKFPLKMFRDNVMIFRYFSQDFLWEFTSLRRKDTFVSVRHLLFLFKIIFCRRQGSWVLVDKWTVFACSKYPTCHIFAFLVILRDLSSISIIKYEY